MMEAFLGHFSWGTTVGDQSALGTLYLYGRSYVLHTSSTWRSTFCVRCKTEKTMYSFNWGNPFQAAAGLVPSARGIGVQPQQQQQSALLGSANQHASNMGLYGMPPPNYVDPNANAAWMAAGMGGYGGSHHMPMPMANLMPMMHHHQAHFMPPTMQNPQNPLIASTPPSNLPRGLQHCVAQQSGKEVTDGSQMKNPAQKWTPNPDVKTSQDDKFKQQRLMNAATGTVAANPVANLNQTGLQLNLAPPPPPPNPPPSSPTRPEAPVESAKLSQDKQSMDPEVRAQGDHFEEDVPILSDEEFEMQLGAWNRQFENWREQNQNHPDRDAYRRYERQWQSWREQLLARREQMRQLSNRIPIKLGAAPSKDITAAEGSNELQNLNRNNKRVISNTSEKIQQMESSKEPAQIGIRPLIGIAPAIPAGRLPRSNEPPLRQQPLSQSRAEMWSENEEFGRPNDGEQHNYDQYMEDATDSFQDQFDQKMDRPQRAMFNEDNQFKRGEHSQEGYADHFGQPRGGQRGGQRGRMMGLQGLTRGRSLLGGPRPLMEGIMPTDRQSFECDEDTWGGLSNESPRGRIAPLFNARGRGRGFGLGQAGRDLHVGYDGPGGCGQQSFSDGDRGGPPFGHPVNRERLLPLHPNRNMGFMSKEHDEAEEDYSDQYNEKCEEEDEVDDHYSQHGNISDAGGQQDDYDNLGNVGVQRGVGLGERGFLRGRGRMEAGFSRVGPGEQGFQRGRGREEASFLRGRGLQRDEGLQRGRGRGEQGFTRGGQAELLIGRGRGDQGFSREGGLREEGFQRGRGRGEQGLLRGVPAERGFQRGRGRGELPFSRGAGLLPEPLFLRGRGRGQSSLSRDPDPMEHNFGNFEDEEDGQDAARFGERSYGRGRGTGEPSFLLGRGRPEQGISRGRGLDVDFQRGRGRAGLGFFRGDKLGGEESVQRGRGRGGELGFLRGRGRAEVDSWEQRINRFDGDDDDDVDNPDFGRSGNDDHQSMFSSRLGNRGFIRGGRAGLIGFNKGETDDDLDDPFVTRFGERGFGRGGRGIGRQGFANVGVDANMEGTFGTRFGNRDFGRGECGGDDDDNQVNAMVEGSFGRNRGLGQQDFERDADIDNAGFGNIGGSRFGRSVGLGDRGFGRGRGAGPGERGFGRGRGAAPGQFAARSDATFEDNELASGAGMQEECLRRNVGLGNRGFARGSGPGGEQSMQRGRGRGEPIASRGRGPMGQNARGGRTGPGAVATVPEQTVQVNIGNPIQSETGIQKQQPLGAQFQRTTRPSLLGDPHNPRTFRSPGNLADIGSNIDKDKQNISRTDQSLQRSNQSLPIQQTTLKPAGNVKPDQCQPEVDKAKNQGAAVITNKSTPTAKVSVPVKPTNVVEPVKPLTTEKQPPEQDNAATACSTTVVAPVPEKATCSSTENKPVKSVDDVPKGKEGEAASAEPKKDQEKMDSQLAAHDGEILKPKQRVSRFAPAAHPSTGDNCESSSKQATLEKPAAASNVADEDDDVEIVFVVPPPTANPLPIQKLASKQGEQGASGPLSKRVSKDSGRPLASNRGAHAGQRSRDDDSEDSRGEKRAGDRGGLSRNQSRDEKRKGDRGRGETMSRERDGDRGKDRHDLGARDRSDSRNRSRGSPPPNRHALDHDGARSTQRGMQMGEARFFQRDSDEFHGKEVEDRLAGYVPFSPEVSLNVPRRRGQNARDVPNCVIYGDMDETYKIEEPVAAPARDFAIKRERLDADVLASVDMRLLAMATGQQLAPTFDAASDRNFEAPAAKVARFEQQSNLAQRMAPNPVVEAPLVAAGGTISRALTEKEQQIIVKTAQNLKALQDQKTMTNLVSALMASKPHSAANATPSVSSPEWSDIERTSIPQRQGMNVQSQEGHPFDHWPQENVYPGSQIANPHARPVRQSHGDYGAPQEESQFYEDRFDEDCDETRNFEIENKPYYSRREVDENVMAHERQFQHRYSDMDTGNYSAWGEPESYQEDEGWDRDEQYSQDWAQSWRDEMAVGDESMEAPVSIDYGHKSVDGHRNPLQRDNYYSMGHEEEDYIMHEPSHRPNRPEPHFTQRREFEDRYNESSRDLGRDRNLQGGSEKSRDLGRGPSRKAVEPDRRDQGRDLSRDRAHGMDRHRSWEGHSQDRDRHRDHRDRSTSRVEESKTKHETVLIEDLIGSKGRRKRPPRVVVILRGLPGSGKTYVAKLIKDKEIEHSGGTSAIRMLCLDDYFSIEVDQTTCKLSEYTDYKYDPVMVDRYRNSLYKTFRKTVDDGFFPFIIVDAIHNKIKHFDRIWNYARQKGFQVYVAEMDTDVVMCHKRNIHNRSLEEIKTILKSWESTPCYYMRVDIRSLLQDAAIPEVEMEDTVAEEEKPKEVEIKEGAAAEKTDSAEIGTSRWEKMEATEEKLAKLDGLRSMKKRDGPKSFEDYLQLPDDYELRQSDVTPGKKRVRWADIEERKQQKRKRAVGFVVGQTDWDSITDPSHADKALTRTKYI